MPVNGLHYSLMRELVHIVPRQSIMTTNILRKISNKFSPYRNPEGISLGRKSEPATMAIPPAADSLCDALEHGFKLDLEHVESVKPQHNRKQKQQQQQQQQGKKNATRKSSSRLTPERLERVMRTEGATASSTTTGMCQLYL